MSVTLEKLHALKRQAGAVSPGGPSARTPSAHMPSAPTSTAEPGIALPYVARADVAEMAGAPPASSAESQPAANALGSERSRASIESLRRLLGVRERKPMFIAAPRGPVDRELPGVEIAPGLRLVESLQPYPTPAADFALDFARRQGDSVRTGDLLFFDTETTGLAGGTGTRAFMIGAADWHVDAAAGACLRIRQLLITTMAAERAMLDEFARWLSPSTVLSSYNGRCYDAPLLKTRYRLARMACPITPLDHVDLLFPTRRRYRGVWENCRLATVERELLKIVREDDLPGSEAPAAWLGYLRGGCARNLRRVAAHNHQDVVTLARLMQRLVEAHAGDDEATAAA